MNSKTFWFRIFLLLSFFFYLLICSQAAREREKAQKAKNKLLQGVNSGASSSATSRASSPVPPSPAPKATQRSVGVQGKKAGTSALPPSSAIQKLYTEQQTIDISSLNLDVGDIEQTVDEPPPKMTLARERVLEEALKAIEDTTKKKEISLVVIGE